MQKRYAFKLAFAGAAALMPDIEAAYAAAADAIARL